MAAEMRARYSELKAAGLCPRCKGAPPAGRVVCDDCVAAVRACPSQDGYRSTERSRARRRRLVEAGICTAPKCGKRVEFTSLERDSWLCAKHKEEKRIRSRAAYAKKVGRPVKVQSPRVRREVEQVDVVEMSTGLGQSMGWASQ